MVAATHECSRQGEHMRVSGARDALMHLTRTWTSGVEALAVLFKTVVAQVASQSSFVAHGTRSGGPEGPPAVDTDARKRIQPPGI